MSRLPSPWLTCLPLFSKRKGTAFDASGKREYTKTWRVVFENSLAGKSAGPVLACFAPGIDLPYTPYTSLNGEEFDLRALLIKLDAEPEYEDDWSQWLVTGSFSTELPKNGQNPLSGNGAPNNDNGDQNNPELKPPDIDWDFEVMPIAWQFDLNGEPFLNSAKQPFTPAPTVDTAVPVLNYSRNELNFDQSVVKKWGYVLNSDVFLGEKPGFVQSLPPKGKLEYFGNRPYYRVSYKFRFRNAGFKWDPEFLDAGLCTLQPNLALPPVQVPIPGGGFAPVPKLTAQPIMENEVPVATAQLLDGNGQRQLPDVNGKVFPVYRKFVTHEKRKFADLLIRLT